MSDAEHEEWLRDREAQKEMARRSRIRRLPKKGSPSKPDEKASKPPPIKEDEDEDDDD